MKEEIKEILDYVFSLAIGEAYTCEYEDIQKARDYITNLQEENEKLTWIKNGELGKVVREKMVDKLSADEMIVIQQKTIDKAIEYIKSNEWAKDYENSNCRTHLLNILQGEE